MARVQKYPFGIARLYVPLAGAQGLFSKDDAKECPHGLNEFFFSQIGAADGNDASGLGALWLVVAAQQHQRRPRGHALKLSNHAAAVLKVVLMDDDGVNRFTRRK